VEPEDPAEEWTREQRDKFVSELEESMRDAAKKFEFEKAAQLRDRDRIKVLKSLDIHEESPVGGPNRHG
jgi:excinuclease ABC subunit B